MKRTSNIERLKHDRRHLLAALRDYKSGKNTHLEEKELASVIENIERRISDLDSRIRTAQIA